MKKVVFIFFIFFHLTVSSQGWVESINISGGDPPFDNNVGLYENQESLTGNRGDWSKISGILSNIDDILLEKRDFNGSVYLFDDWNNKSKITINNKNYSLPNMNYNVEKNVFAFKSKDSIYTFEDAVVEKALINNKFFKTINLNGINDIYQVIYKGKNFECLKKYTLRLINASANPMVNRNKSTIKKDYKYYILKDENLINFKLKKSSFFKMPEFKKYKKEILQFVKNNNLSFKKEKDIKFIFAYANKL